MKTLKILLLFVISFITITSCTNEKKENKLESTVTNLQSQIEKLEAENSALVMVRPEALAEKMNMYVIEREIPALGEWSAEDLKGASQTSCGVLKEMGSDIQWLHSYITGDKMYCVYLAPNKEMVLEHAKKGGFPANAVNSVATIISPETAE
jgi:outer membrane murein-binding lipoprotein Lpp